MFREETGEKTSQRTDATNPSRYSTPRHGSVGDLVLVVLQHVVGAAAEAQARVVDDFGHEGRRLALAGRGGEPAAGEGDAERGARLADSRLTGVTGSP